VLFYFLLAYNIRELHPGENNLSENKKAIQYN
jgi:hypothetical protein